MSLSHRRSPLQSHQQNAAKEHKSCSSFAPEGKGYSDYDLISADAESSIPLDLSPGGPVIKSSRKTPGVLQPARQPVTFALDVFSAPGDLVANLRKVFEDGGRGAGKTCWEGKHCRGG